MLLIQSSSNDKSSIDVLDWVFYLSRTSKITRINDRTYIKKTTYRVSNSNEDLLLKTDDKLLSNKINSYWYRRGEFSYLKLNPLTTSFRNSNLLESHIQHNLYREQEHILNSINNMFCSHINLNKFQDNLLNKLNTLSKAKFVGLNIPETILTNCPVELRKFCTKYDKVLTKDLEFNPIRFSYNDEYNVQIHTKVKVYTKQEINLNINNRINTNSSHPSLFQAYIDKRYELRIFFIEDVYYPMAIFSQANDKTKNDFRNYDPNRPNRCVSYKLPKEIEIKLSKLMKNLSIKSGSIDMIVTPKLEYVFLEVNPVGRFQWLSKNCNFDIERQIALYLIANEK